MLKSIGKKSGSMTRFIAVGFVCAAGLLAHAQDQEPEDSLLQDILSPSEPLSDVQLQRLALVDRHLDRDPLALIEGNRLTYLFGRGQPSLVCAPFRICTLILAPGERIAEDGLLIGAETMWEVVQVYVAGNDALHIALRPKDAGLRNSLVIITKGAHARYYHVELLSDPEAYMPLVSFRYQDQAREDINNMIAAAQGANETDSSPAQLNHAIPGDFGVVSHDDLNFAYEVTGCRTCTWRPEQVFDDGTRTIIVLPAESTSQPLPLPFIVGKDSKEQLANSHFDDPSIIVHGLFDEALLRRTIGRRQQEVSIRRKSQ